MASISVAVVSYQAGLRSRASEKNPWHTGGQDSEVERVQLTRLPPHTAGNPSVWVVPIGVAQEVGDSQLHLEKTWGYMSREWEDG